MLQTPNSTKRNEQRRNRNRSRNPPNTKNITFMENKNTNQPKFEIRHRDVVLSEYRNLRAVRSSGEEDKEVEFTNFTIAKTYRNSETGNKCRTYVFDEKDVNKIVEVINVYTGKNTETRDEYSDFVHDQGYNKGFEKGFDIGSDEAFKQIDKLIMKCSSIQELKRQLRNMEQRKEEVKKR